MTRRKWVLPMAAVAGLALSAFGGIRLATERPDCPGKIICPLTGQLVCKDRCPLHENRESAPGSTQKPSCCSKGKTGS